MKNKESCAFWIYTDTVKTNIEQFDTLSELKEICQDNGLDYQEQKIELGDGGCKILNDEDFTGFYEIQLDFAITDYHLKLYEQGKLFEHQ